MNEYYVKVKPFCDNCAYECCMQLGPKEKPRWYCSKGSRKNPLPDECTCSEFKFDDNIIKPTIIRGDYFIKNKEE